MQGDAGCPRAGLSCIPVQVWALQILQRLDRASRQALRLSCKAAMLQCDAATVAARLVGDAAPPGIFAGARSRDSPGVPSDVTLSVLHRLPALATLQLGAHDIPVTEYWLSSALPAAVHPAGCLPCVRTLTLWTNKLSAQGAFDLAQLLPGLQRAELHAQLPVELGRCLRQHCARLTWLALLEDVVRPDVDGLARQPGHAGEEGLAVILAELQGQGLPDLQALHCYSCRPRNAGPLLAAAVPLARRLRELRWQCSWDWPAFLACTAGIPAAALTCVELGGYQHGVRVPYGLDTRGLASSLIAELSLPGCSADRNLWTLVLACLPALRRLTVASLSVDQRTEPNATGLDGEEAQDCTPLPQLGALESLRIVAREGPGARDEATNSTCATALLALSATPALRDLHGLTTLMHPASSLQAWGPIGEQLAELDALLQRLEDKGGSVHVRAVCISTAVQQLSANVGPLPYLARRVQLSFTYTPYLLDFFAGPEAGLNYNAAALALACSVCSQHMTELSLCSGIGNMEQPLRAADMLPVSRLPALERLRVGGAVAGTAVWVHAVAAMLSAAAVARGCDISFVVFDCHQLPAWPYGVDAQRMREVASAHPRVRFEFELTPDDEGNKCQFAG